MFQNFTQKMKCGIKNFLKIIDKKVLFCYNIYTWNIIDFSKHKFSFKNIKIALKNISLNGGFIERAVMFPLCREVLQIAHTKMRKQFNWKNACLPSRIVRVQIPSLAPIHDSEFTCLYLVVVKKTAWELRKCHISQDSVKVAYQVHTLKIRVRLPFLQPFIIQGCSSLAEHKILALEMYVRLIPPPPKATSE